VELAFSEPWWLGFEVTDGLKITKSLIEAQEWGKLECWIGIVWMFSGSPGAVGMTEEDLENSMLLLFRQRPGAAQRLGVDRTMEPTTHEVHPGVISTNLRGHTTSPVTGCAP
jgi:hypothetical protein